MSTVPSHGMRTLLLMAWLLLGCEISWPLDSAGQGGERSNTETDGGAGAGELIGGGASSEGVGGIVSGGDGVGAAGAQLGGAGAHDGPGGLGGFVGGEAGSAMGGESDTAGAPNEAECVPGISAALPCPGGPHVCTPGVRECVFPGKYSAECSGRVLGLEREVACDALDEDCDGGTDDEFFVGAPCVAPGTCGAGTLECASQTQARCSTGPGGSNDRSSVDTCDAAFLDEDCDGSANQGCSCVAGALRACGEHNLGECHWGTQDCDGATGAWGPCLGAREPTGEVCDNRDNDCNGVTDDDAIIPGDRACTSGVGECLRVGTRICASGQVSCSASAAGGASETCDDRDNDCNSFVDEDYFVGAPCEGHGRCGAGSLECASLARARCSTDPGGSQDESTDEVCDAAVIDEDCDGSANEGCACASGARRPCGTSNIGECHFGEQVCDAASNSWGTCNGAIEPVLEVCDGQDNDCDGDVDNGIVLPGDLACPVGLGDCQRLGTKQCRAGQVLCDAEPGAATAEVCDGRDNDCDASVDEDYFVGAPCEGKGRCGAGSLECASLTQTRCTTQPGGSDDESAVEVCDAALVDEDCDGGANEGCTCLDGARRGCGTSSIGECRFGEQTCDSARNAWGPCAGAVEPGVELCDGKDNDCDGRLDEDVVLPEGEACEVGEGECRRAASKKCSAGQIVCDGKPGAPTPELCDGKDNDCDSSIDEDFDFRTNPQHCSGCRRPCSFANAEAACVAANCRMAECQPGFGDADRDPSNGCECLKTVPADEICDGHDNDCNGLADAVLAGGRADSVCVCDPVDYAMSVYRRDTDDQNLDCTTGQCSPLGGGPAGLVKMDFCCAANGAWSQCVMAAGSEEARFSLGAFDADHGGRGVLEVVLRLSERVTSFGLDLWYGVYPKRKKLVLLGADGSSVGPGTIVLYLKPEDAECPEYTPADLLLEAFQGFPSQCIATRDPKTNRVCADGRWTNIDPSCGFEREFDHSLIYLTAESCTATVRSAVTLVSLRYFEEPLKCMCRAQEDCADQRSCHLEAELDLAACPECTGLCSSASQSCQGEGEPCTVIVGGRSCASQLACVGEDAVCPLPAMCP